MRLRRSVPFVGLASGASATSDEPGRPVMLVDRVEVPAPAGAALLARLRETLYLGAANDMIDVETAEALVEGQYRACLEHMYSHPAWAAVRAGAGAAFLRGYLLENRHYLAAAPMRMASGIGPGRPDRLNELQARHVVEEAGHEEYFDNGLIALGCAHDRVRASRPSPVTVEWIHLMRTVVEASPLSAALCSGLLEFTAGNREAVTGWHEHLVTSAQLPAPVVDAIFEHVRVDLGLGHGQNWRHALHAAGGIRAEQLADALNDTTLIAEMIVRWTQSLVYGLSGDLVPQLTSQAPIGVDHGQGEGGGLVVWPSGLLDLVAHGDPTASGGTRAAVALAYGLAPTRGAAGSQPTVPGAAADLCGNFADALPERPTGDDLEKLVIGWMRTVDGHTLWTQLVQRPTLALVRGWLVENYHYIASIWQHCGAALATCTDPEIRTGLVHHLREEFEHGAMLREGIAGSGLAVEAMRPLATTRAFVGYLRGLAQRDWRAYVLAVAYLQLSLTTAGSGEAVRVHARHAAFYDTLLAALPEAASLVATMRRHDAEDSELDHGEDVRQLLHRLATLGVPQFSIDAAAALAQLTWSFLDGIAEHYGKGDVAVITRMGWSVTRPAG